MMQLLQLEHVFHDVKVSRGLGTYVLVAGVQSALETLTANGCSGLSTITLQLPKAMALKELSISGRMCAGHSSSQVSLRLTVEHMHCRCWRAGFWNLGNLIESAVVLSLCLLPYLVRRVRMVDEGCNFIGEPAQPEHQWQLCTAPPGSQMCRAHVPDSIPVPPPGAAAGRLRLPQPQGSQLCRLQLPARCFPQHAQFSVLVASTSSRELQRCERETLRGFPFGSLAHADQCIV